MWGVKANLREACKYARAGALCWIININPGWGSERVVVLMRSRGGRLIEIWVTMKRLTNLRAAYMPPHVQRRFGWHFNTKDEAQRWAKGVEEAHCVKPLSESNSQSQQDIPR